MRFSLHYLFILFIVLSSCKTREDIKREKLVEDMNIQMQDGQKLNADFSVRLAALEEQLSNITGKVEESQYETKQSLLKRIVTIEERMALLETSQKTATETLEKILVTQKEQKNYINEVLKNLKSISKNATPSKATDLYKTAIANYRKGRYKTSKKQLLALLNGKKVKSSQRAHALHNLGMIAFMSNKNDEAIEYFIKLSTEFPKAGYNKNGLLHLAKAFKNQKKKDAARATLEELIGNFPKSKQSKTAKKMLQSL